MSYIKCFNVATGGVASEFGKLMNIKSDCDIREADACLLDLSNGTHEISSHIDTARQAGKPIILLNVPEGATIPGCIALMRTRAAILILEDEYSILNVLDTQAGTIIGGTDSMAVDLEKHSFTDVVSEQLSVHDVMISDESLALAIETAIAPSAVLEMRMDMAAEHERRRTSDNGLDDVSILPSPQYKKQYTIINRSYSLGEATQICRTRMVLEFALFASYEGNGGSSSKKHLRIATLRNAQGSDTVYSMGNLQWNDTYDRGVFIEYIIYDSSSGNSSLTIADTKPSSIGAGLYSSSYIVPVGVDTSKYIYYNPQYTIGASMQYDCGSYYWIGSGGAVVNHFITSYGAWQNMFDEPFCRKAQVKGIPNNPGGISPLYQRRYVCPATFESAVNVTCNVSVRLAEFYVTGNWASYTKHYRHWDIGISASFTANFKEVSC